MKVWQLREPSTESDSGKLAYMHSRSQNFTRGKSISQPAVQDAFDVLAELTYVEGLVKKGVCAGVE
jgi:hypothetical protein